MANMDIKQDSKEPESKSPIVAIYTTILILLLGAAAALIFFPNSI